MSYARDGRWDMAEKSFRRAVELEPSRSETYGDFAMYLLLTLGRSREALDWMRVAQRSDPLSPDSRLHLTWVLFSTHRYDEAERECDKLEEPYRSDVSAGPNSGKGRSAKPLIFLPPKSPAAYPLAQPSAAISHTGLRESGVAMRLRKSLKRIERIRFIRYWRSWVWATRTAPLRRLSEWLRKAPCGWASRCHVQRSKRFAGILVRRRFAKKSACPNSDLPSSTPRHQCG